MRMASVLNWLVAVAGLWEVLSPFILGYSVLTVAMWNALIVGAVLIVLGVWAALSHAVTTDRTLDWINAGAGVWLVVSPFVLNYSTMTTILSNSVIVGLVAIMFGAWAALTATETVSPQM